jgi:phospholipid/cholesterol/gamma-HCH transport system substrate-binding protein
VSKVFTPFRVGILVLAALGILFALLTFVKKGGMGRQEGVELFAYFRDASGLGKKSRVQIAGIEVGELKDIRLEGTRARVTILVRRDLSVREDAALTKRSESLLGDYMIDLTPGSESARVLKDGEQITRVIDAQGMEQVFNSLNAITADIQQVTSSLRSVLGGEKGQGSLEAIVKNLVTLTESVDSTVRDSQSQLNTILGNVEAVTTDIRTLTQGEQGSIRRIVQNVEGISKDVRDVMVTVKRVVGDNEGDIAGGVSNVKELLAKLDRSLENVETITRDIKEGKGAVGALVSNERLGQKLTDTVEDVADFAGRLTSTQLEASVRVDYLINQGSAKNFFGLRLVPRPDKYYLIEVVDDPRGSIETLYVQQNPPTAGAPVIQKQTITKESLKFSAQIAKRFSFLTLRFGIIESTGGIGADVNIPIKFFYYSRWLEDALVLKIDAFNFSVESLVYPRLRASLRLTPFAHVYVNIGVDDILNRPSRDSLTNRLVSGQDFFFGAGLYFTDDDLRSILPLVPSF